jgi:serine/threonine protein kinase
MLTDAADGDDARIGRTLAGYRLMRVLGMGGTSTVYLGESVADTAAPPVAVKLLAEASVATSAAERATFRARFLRTAGVAAKLHHPHILRVLSYGEDDGLCYLTAPYLDGGTLAARMTARQEEGRGPLPLSEVAAYLMQVAGALDYAHHLGVVHRDVKPANLMLDGRGELALTDFGIARLFAGDGEALTRPGGEALTRTGQILGTVYYMAPEQIRGELVGPAADIYALGVVLYQLVTGRVPFAGDTPLAVAMRHLQDPPEAPHLVRRELPPPLDAVILRALAKEPSARWETAGALARAFAVGAGEVRGSSMRAELVASAGAPAREGDREDLSATHYATDVASGNAGYSGRSDPTARSTPPPQVPLVREPPPAPGVWRGTPDTPPAYAEPTERVGGGMPVYGQYTPSAGPVYPQYTPGQQAMWPGGGGQQQGWGGAPPGVATRPGAGSPFKVLTGTTGGRIALIVATALLLITACIGSLRVLGPRVQIGNNGTTNRQGGNTPPPSTATTAPTVTPNVIYRDSLTNSPSGWFTSAQSQGHCSPQGDGYHVKDSFVCFAPPAAFSDGDFAVDAKEVSGATNAAFGIVFRAGAPINGQVLNYYHFDINSQGVWVFQKVANGSVTQITPDTADGAIQRGLNTVNHLRVRAYGGHIEFYVNGTKVGQSDEPTFASGRWGLDAGAGAESAFSNLTITAG